VIADNMVATMDEHGRRLPAGQLDALFGVRQELEWKAGDSRSWLDLLRGRTPPAPKENAVAKGRAFYLNVAMHDYAELREDGGRRAAFERVLRTAGIEAPVRVIGSTPVKVYRFAGAGSEYVALMQNPPGSKVSAARPARVHVVFARSAALRQGGRDLGVLKELDVDLDPSRPALLEVGSGR
jgi:hypothetical protein